MAKVVEERIGTQRLMVVQIAPGQYRYHLWDQAEGRTIALGVYRTEGSAR